MLGNIGDSLNTDIRIKVAAVTSKKQPDIGAKCIQIQVAILLSSTMTPGMPRQQQERL